MKQQLISTVILSHTIPSLFTYCLSLINGYTSTTGEVLSTLVQASTDMFKKKKIKKKPTFFKTNFSSPGGVATVAYVCGTAHAGVGL
jgi:hypothetical protein